MLKVFQVKKGDQFSFLIKFKNLNQVLTTLKMGIKEDYDSPMLIEKSLGDGITKISATTYQVNYSPDDTNELEPSMYIFDLRYTIGTTTKTPLSGYLIINNSVFNNEEE